MRLSDARPSYGLRLDIALKNISDQKLSESDIFLALGPGLGEYPIEGLGIAKSLYSYVQPVYSIDGEIESENMQRGDDPAQINLDDKKLNWAGLESRYFALLLSPVEANAVRAIECRVGESPGDHLPARYLPEILLYLDTSELQPGEVRKSSFDVFSGPKSSNALKSETHDYQALLFSGQWQWMRWLCFGLLYVLSFIHTIIFNWGLSILILALLVRGALYPLSRKMMADQQKFAQVQEVIGPEIKEIKGKYKGEEQSEAILSLYKKHGVSPFTGMKPLLIVLIQLPVFIALFHVLGQAVELQGASFLWIDSLGLPDRLFSFGRDLPFFGAYFNILPFLMALSTLLTITLSPSSGQNSIFLVIMAVGFLLLFYPFPSGMVLYWTMANLLQIFQQMLVKRKTAA
jgi:YidC/Oxa1 family membrane protein insertase